MGKNSELKVLISEIERRIDLSAEMPQELFLFLSRITPLVNVDLLIQDDERGTLLTWRADRHFGPGWHVPGGIIRHKELAADRIRAVARQELATTVSFDPKPIHVQENVRHAWRDRSHAISLLYRCRLARPLDPSRRFTPDAPRPDQWLWHESCPANLIPEQQAYATYMK
jgi:colanic acid biosynthesis protein WcaH